MLANEHSVRTVSHAEVPLSYRCACSIVRSAVSWLLVADVDIGDLSVRLSA